MRRPSSSLAPAFAVAMAVSLGARPGLAAFEPAMSFDQIAQAWMGAVALLAHDVAEHRHEHGREHGERGHGGERAWGARDHRDHDHGHARGGDGRERCECGGDDCKKCRGERCGCGKDGCDTCGREGGRSDAGRHVRGDHGRPGPRASMEGPRAAVAKMDEILARLGRIEAKLDGRAGGPPRVEMRAPMPPMGGQRREGRPEVPAEVREQARKRMEEGRERMDQARQAFRQMEERIKKLEAEIERLKSDR